MCGIAGIIHFDSSSDALYGYKGAVERMTNALVSRGPDSFGHYHSDSVSLGHRRLSIIDPSIAGRQPMQLLDNESVIVFNGEIYNYRSLRATLISLNHSFVSNTDTEVILRSYEEWGLSGLLQLEGIFSIAIWNPRSENLLIMRDRLGVKPLYFSSTSTHLLFSSEIRSLLQSGLITQETNDQAFAEYLWYGNTFSDRNFYSSIKTLLPGHMLSISRDGIKLFPWWKIEDHIGVSPILDTDLLTASLTDLIDRSVSRQLVSDVPTGLFLSGGIDSSALAASIAAQPSHEITSFTANFSFQATNNDYQRSQTVAKHCGLSHEGLEIINNNLEATIELLSKAHGQPFADAANIPLHLMCKSVRERGIKVVLQGDGGDELFGGYRRYQLLSNFPYFPGFPLSLLRAFSQTSRASYRISRLALALGQQHDDLRMAYLLTEESPISPPESLLTKDRQQHLRETVDPLLAYRDANHRFSEYDPLTKLMLTDLTVQLPSQFLTKVDISSMSAGVEARVPLLDEQIVNFALSLPFHLKVHRSKSKRLLRDSVKHRLPTSIVKASKAGFGVPYSSWLKTSLFKYSAERILDPSFIDHFGFDAQRLAKLLNTHRSSSSNVHAFTLWKILQLSLWHNTSNVS